MVCGQNTCQWTWSSQLSLWQGASAYPSGTIAGLDMMGLFCLNPLLNNQQLSIWRGLSKRAFSRCDYVGLPGLAEFLSPTASSESSVFPMGQLSNWLRLLCVQFYPGTFLSVQNAVQISSSASHPHCLCFLPDQYNPSYLELSALYSSETFVFPLPHHQANIHHT